MSSFQSYPGTPQHQHLLNAVVNYYADDPRILAIIVFGSLGRGNWDPYSDLDMDVIIVDDTSINVISELEQMFNSFANISEYIALIIPDGEDAGDIVLRSLMGLSIRYHPLGSTSPNIIDSMVILTGQINEATIKAAGQANKHATDIPIKCMLDMCVRYIVEVDRALQRRHIWLAIEIEHRIRGLLMELFTQAHKGRRPLHTFQNEAAIALQSLLGSTLPRFDLPSLQKVLITFIDILEQELSHFALDKVQLTEAHVQILNQVRSRQTNLEMH